MKTRIGFIALLGLIVTTSVLLPLKDTKPDFVENSVSRLQSYLAQSYGPVKCSTQIMDNENWDVICNGGYKKQTFEFVTHRAEDEKSYKGAYYLLAKNDSAKKS